MSLLPENKEKRDAFLRAVCTGFAVGLVVIGLAIQTTQLLQGQWQILGNMVFYLFLLVLFITRKPSQVESTSPLHWFFAIGGTFTAFLLQPVTPSTGELFWVSLAFQLVGLVLSLTALGALGRAFGIIAAKRDIKTHGLYRYIRHPLYTGEAIWLLGLVLKFPSPFNFAVMVTQIAFQIKRMLDEEALLANDPEYADYLSRVKARMLPGIF